MGSVMLLVLVAKVITNRRGSSLAKTESSVQVRAIRLDPYFEGTDRFGFQARYDVAPASRLGVRVLHDGAADEEVRASVVWNLKF